MNNTFLPNLADLLNAPPQPAAQPMAAGPQPSGTGNWFTSALGSGAYGALGAVGSAGEALGRVAGFDGLADQAQQFAAQQRAKAAAYARPDLESGSLWNPEVLAYRATQMLPGLGAALAGSVAGAALAPEEGVAAGLTGLGGVLARNAGAVGGAAAMFPQMVGENVQRQEDYSGPLTQGQAGKALALGVPEAALQAILPARIEQRLLKGVAPEAGADLLAQVYHGVKAGVVTQLPVGATTEWLMGQMGDPNRSFADRAQDIVNAALQGAVLGGVTGGAASGLGGLLHGFAKIPAAGMTNQDMTSVLDASQQPPTPPQGPAPLPPIHNALDASQQPPASLPPLYDALNAVGAGFGRAPGEAANSNAVEDTTSWDQYNRPMSAGPATPQSPLQMFGLNDPLAASRAYGPVNAVDAANNNYGTFPASADAAPTPQPPVELGRPAAIPPRNDNEPPPPYGEATPAPDLDLGNGPGQPVNDDQPFKWTSLRASLQKVAKGLPDELKGQKFDSLEQVQDAVASGIAQSGSEGKLGVVAQKLGVTDESGQLTGRFAVAPQEPAADPVGGAPERVEREAIPEKHQGRWTDLEAIRSILLGDNLSDPGVMGLLSKTADLQNELQQPGRRVGAIVKETKNLKVQVDGLHAAQENPIETPLEQEAPATPNVQPSPQAQGFVARMRATKAAKGAPAQPAAPTLPDVVPPPAPVDPQTPLTAQASRQQQFTQSLTQVEAGDKHTPVPQAIHDRIGQANARLEAMKGLANNDPQLLAGIAEQQNRLSQYTRAAQTGMEGLRLVPPDHFGTEFSDNMGDRASPELQQAMQEHAEDEQDFVDYASKARGERPLIGYATPPTQQDADLAHIVNSGGGTQDALGYLRQHGTDVQAKEMAATLARSGVDPSVQFASSDQARQDLGQALGLNEVIKGSHNDALNRINLYDGSDLEHTLLHEAAHAATVRAIEGNGPASRDLQNIFDQVKDRSPDNDLYGLRNKAEFVAEAFSNREFRDFLRNEPLASTGNGVGDMWSGFKNAVFKALGMNGRVRTLFDQVMDNANQLIKENPDQPASPQERFSIVNKGVKIASHVGDLMRREGWRALGEEMQGLRRNIAPPARATLLNMVNSDHIGYLLAHPVPSAKSYVELMAHPQVRGDLLAKPFVKATTLGDKLPEKGKEALNRLMARSAQNIDPRISWDRNTWLKDDPSVDVLKQEHADAVKDMDALRRIPGGVETYEAHRAAYSFANYMKQMHNMQDYVLREQPGREAPAFATDVFRDYETQTKLQDDPIALEAWAKARHAQQFAEIKQVHSDSLTAEKGLKKQLQGSLPKDQRRTLKTQLAAATDNRRVVASLVNAITRSAEKAKEGPFFHLGRDGNYFAAAHLSKDENGVPLSSSIDALRNGLDASGFPDVAVMHGLNNDSFYVRLAHPNELYKMEQLLRNLQDAGHLDPAKDISTGEAHQPQVYGAVGPAFLRQAIEAVRQSAPDIPPGATRQEIAALSHAHEQQQRELTRALMSTLPEDSISKMYQRREGVQGFDANMFESYRHGGLSAARGLSYLSMARDIGQAAKQMNDELTASSRNGSLSTQQRIAASQGVGELVTRAKSFQSGVPGTAMNALRQMTHTLQVGMSPIYFMTLGSQNLTLTLPEFTKTHGAVRSAKAMAAAAVPTFKVMRAVATGAEGSTFGMRDEDLKRAGFNAEDTRMLMTAAARGAFNQGGRTEAMTGHEAGSKFGKAVQMANSMGRYAEMTPRVLAAFAARDLYNQRPVTRLSDGTEIKNADDFIYHSVMNSQMNWNPTLNARFTTRAGTFGKMSPLINQFMGFHTRMTEKLYREWADAFSSQRPNETVEQSQERRTQARKWAAMHAGAVTMLAGTLGLPMVSVFASVYDRLKDALTGEDSNDIIATYRNYLAQTFGKELGEAIARGAPRLVGADFDHLGEDRIAPGSTSVLLATEKRKMEDAEKDWLKDMAGSSVGELFNLAAAGRDFANGDYLNSAIHIAPELFKGPLEAARLAKYGFVDQNGMKMPMTVSAEDLALKAVGIDPAKEAEYDEERKVATGLTGMRQMRSQNITRHLLLAQSRGDGPNMGYWQDQAMRYQMDHPGMLGPLAEFGRNLSTHMRSAALARGFGTPLGVQPRDVVGRGMTAFGNLRNDQ